jgi:Resolvase, N terminal domain
MVAIGYARRSKESGAKTVSLADQAEQIHRYAAQQGWTLAELVIDDGVSGGKRARLTRLEDVVRAHRARVVVVYHLDRNARDVAALLDGLRAYSRRGVELHVVGRGRVEADSASGFLLTGVEGLMAEHYRRLIAEKTRDSLEHLPPVAADTPVSPRSATRPKTAVWSSTTESRSPWRSSRPCGALAPHGGPSAASSRRAALPSGTATRGPWPSSTGSPRVNR